MRFTVNDQIYTIEFQRQFIDVPNPTNPEESFKSKYPSTTVKILEYKPDLKSKDWPIYAEATVNCLPTDAFSHESGRLYALKKIGYSLGYGMRVAMWEAYHKRERTTPRNLQKENEQLKAEILKLKLQLKDARDPEARED